MQTLQYELGNFKAISADVRINPDLSALHLDRVLPPQEMIDRGAEAAERALPDIKRVLADKLRRDRSNRRRRARGARQLAQHREAALACQLVDHAAGRRR